MVRLIQKTLFAIILAILATIAFVPNQAHAARTDNTWDVGPTGTYIKTTVSGGWDILINGISKYLNFGTTSGSSGYGFRDNAGTIQWKNSGGSWANIGSGGGGGATLFTDLTDVPASYTGEALKMVRVNAGETGLEFTTAPSGTPGGSEGQMQFNDGGSFNGTAVITTPDNGGTFYLQDKFSLIVDDGDDTKAFRFEASGLTSGSLRIVAPQDRSGTMALLEDNLGNFASTTSAQLALVLTDEQGSGGGFVRATSPTLTTPNIGSASASALNVSGLTASRVVVTDGSKNLASSAVTSTELGYSSGVTSSIQPQINTKAPTASPTFTGTLTTPDAILGTAGAERVEYASTSGYLRGYDASNVQKWAIGSASGDSQFSSLNIYNGTSVLANIDSSGVFNTLAGARFANNTSPVFYSDAYTTALGSLNFSGNGIFSLAPGTGSQILNIDFSGVTGTKTLSAPNQTGTIATTSVTSLPSLNTIDTTLTGPLYATAGVISTLPTRASVTTFSTTSTSYVDITGLAKTLAVNTSYTFRIIGEWTSNNNSGQATIGFVVPSGATATMTRFMGTTSSAINSSMQNSNNQVSNVAIGTANGIRTVMATGTVIMGGTAGDLQIRLASNNASYTATVQNIVLEVTPF